MSVEGPSFYDEDEWCPDESAVSVAPAGTIRNFLYGSTVPRGYGYSHVYTDEWMPAAPSPAFGNVRTEGNAHFLVGADGRTYKHTTSGWEECDD